MAALDKVADMLPSFQHSLLSLSGCASFGFLRDVMGWRHPALKHCAVTESLSKNRLDVWCHENVVALSTRPEFIQRDERGRLHCSHGPSVRYRDGVMLYHWHGVEVPAAVVERPQDITVRQIEDEPNFEIRRVMVERYELARYIVDSGATVVHELPADHPLPGLRTARLLRRAARWRAPISFEDELERIEYELAQEDEDKLTGEVRTGEPIFYVDLLNSTPEPDGSVKRYVLRGPQGLRR